MTSRKSLKINQKSYKQLLATHFKHRYYFSTFNSLRKQHQKFDEATVSPSLDDFSTGTTTFNLELPYPVSSPMVASDETDHCIDLLTAKENFEHRMQSFLVPYRHDKKYLTQKYVTDTKYAKLPKYIIDMCMGQYDDPDKYFSGIYDWYYTGGALDMIEIDNCTYFMHSELENRLCLTYLDDPTKVFPLEGVMPKPIYNVKAYFNDANYLVTVRQKHAVHILQLVTDNGLSAKILLTNESNKVPFIDIKYSKNEACILGLNHKLQTVDVRSNKGTMHHTFSKDPEPSDSFSQVEYRTVNEVIFLDRNTVRLLDKRSKTEKTFILKRNYFQCDNLCVMLPSQADDNYLFVCSVHNIFKLDVREMKIVKKWSHLLSIPPLMVQSRLFDGDEILFVSTQNYAERLILCSNKSETNLVQLIPSNEDALRKCDLTYNFNLGEKFRERLEFSTAGIKIAQSKDAVLDLYTCNCNGDIFKNEMTRGYHRRPSSSEPLAKLNDWIGGLSKKPVKLEVTSLREMSKWKVAFMESPEEDLLARYTRPNNVVRDRLLRAVETYETDMTAIWRSDEENTVSNLVPPSEITSRHKVTEWLQSANGTIESGDSDIER